MGMKYKKPKKKQPTKVLKRQYKNNVSISYNGQLYHLYEVDPVLVRETINALKYHARNYNVC